MDVEYLIRDVYSKLSIPSKIDPINRSLRKMGEKGVDRSQNACFVAKLYEGQLKLWIKILLMKLLAMNEL